MIENVLPNNYCAKADDYDSLKSISPNNYHTIVNLSDDYNGN